MLYDLFLTIVFFLSSFGFSEFNEISTCNDDEVFEVVCGFQNPEDLYLSPSETKIIVSEFGSLAPNTKFGNLVYFDLSTNKKELISKKLLLEENQSVLDIGCGWGGMAAHIYKKSNANVVGVTLSEEQIAYAKQRKIREKLEKVEYRLQDYRNVNEKYDRIVSVGMFEHVGTAHYQEFFNKVYDLLNDSGVALIHTIGRLNEPGNTDPWIDKYIFPGGYIPALSETVSRVEKSGLSLTDVQVLRFHYAETLKRWRYNFYDNIDKVKEIYDEKFCRMWDFYLSSSQASFEESTLVVFQMQLSKNKKTVPDSRNYMLT